MCPSFRAISLLCVAMTCFMSGVPALNAGPGSGASVISPSPIEIRVDCLNASGIDSDRVGQVMRELRDMSGIRIIATESVSESAIRVDIDRTRADNRGVGPDDVIRSVVANTQFPVISRDGDSVTFEYIRGRIGIQEMGRVEVATFDGEPVRLSDIAIIRLGAHPFRRPYVPGDRFVIIRVTADQDAVHQTEETLRRRLGGLAWITWKKIGKE